MRYLFFLLALSACATVNPQGSELIATSKNYVGLHERADRRYLTYVLGVDPVRTEWCAAFVNSILIQNGHPTSASVNDNPLLARSFVDYGEKVVGEPRQGDIVVLKRGEPWQGHVGFYLRTQNINGRQHYILISGNDNDSVTIEAFPVSRVVAVRRVDL